MAAKGRIPWVLGLPPSNPKIGNCPQYHSRKTTVKQDFTGVAASGKGNSGKKNFYP
jgi:hypothetical protein